MRRLGILASLVVVIQLFMPLRQSLAADIIGPDDVLRISVYGYDDLKTETRVSADGRITFPLIGELVAKGKSSIDLEETIAAKLVDGGFIHKANVSVVVLEHVSQFVSVLGYVNKPGRYALNSDSSILDVIAMAGGIINGGGASVEAGSNTVQVKRNSNGVQENQVINIEDFLQPTGTSSVFKMQQGDVVYVPKAAMFYIYGEVAHPGSFRLEQHMTVLKALSLAGGLTPRGTENGIIVKRKDGGDELKELDVEPWSEVLRDDVIYVGERWF